MCALRYNSRLEISQTSGDKIFFATVRALRYAGGAMSFDLTKPDVILTHESDLDAFVAGILLRRLAKKLFDADVRLEAWNYNGFKQRPMNESTAWITDFTFETRFDRSGWLVVDHHVTEVPAKNAHLI